MSPKLDMEQLPGLKSGISALLQKETRMLTEDRQLGDLYRAVLRMYQDSASRRPAGKKARNENDNKLALLACEAFLYLGSEGSPCSVSLKDYNHIKYGPFLGVSDEGSAAQAIRKAALSSPKIRAIGSASPIVVGVAHDAERLGSIGEVPVGPEEYATIWRECTGRILTSTNIGTRLNLRFYKRHPVVTVGKGPGYKSVLRRARLELKEAFSPFLHTPDGKPRPLTVYIEFDRESRRTFKERVRILKALSEFIKRKGVADHDVHQLGFQMRIGFGEKGCNAALLAIEMASAAGLKKVSIDGVVRKEADERVSLPGLLNYLEPNHAASILDRARQRSIHIHPKNTVDVDSVARGVWSNLNTARNMGLDLGKYGTFPLILGECDEVVRKVQGWFRDWTAAPVFFVDQDMISHNRVYTRNNIVAGLKEWLKIMKKHKVPVVLIDTVDKSKEWRLLKTGKDPKGILSRVQIQKIERLASVWNIKVLWAGGISLPQVYEFGKMGVFGIYVTSAAARLGPVQSGYERDPLLASLKEPSIEGVSLAKLLLEAGFLVSRLQNSKEASKLEELAGALIELVLAKHPDKEIKRAKRELFSRTIDAWKIHL